MGTGMNWIFSIGGIVIGAGVTMFVGRDKAMGADEQFAMESWLSGQKAKGKSTAATRFMESKLASEQAEVRRSLAAGIYKS